MTHDALEHKNNSPQSDSEDDLMASFLERVKEMSPTNGSRLKDLFDQGDTEAFEAALDDVVYNVAFEDPAYAANAKRIRALEGSRDRRRQEEARALADQQRKAVEGIRQLVMLEAGLSTKEAGTEIEKAREEVADRLTGVDLSETSSNDILRKLGILTEGEEGGEKGPVFTYPEDLFPEGTNTKWSAYIDAVQTHMNLAEEVSGGAVDRDALGRADANRRTAHNAVAEDVDKILGFSNLPNEQWDFESTRRLVAKMREAKFVGKETGETKLTALALMRGMGAHVLTKLNEPRR